MSFRDSSEFENLNVCKFLVKQCTAMGITTPTPVQQFCIPKILKRENCIAIAPTGSGKTLAFALPIIQVLLEDPHPLFAVILTPTRELAIQIADQFTVILKPLNMGVSVIIGGMNMVKQGGEIHARPYIVVATPGRLADLLQSGYDEYFKGIKFVVLDEADRLLEEGQFPEQMDVIFDVFPRKRQTLLFSATISKDIEDWKKESGFETFICPSLSETSTVEKLDQQFVSIPKLLLKGATLVQVINSFQEKYPDYSIIVFTKNCEWCQIVSVALRNLGFKNVVLNSKLKQHERTAAISKFKSNRIKLLVSTDIASRGLDIPMVELVINYNVPQDPRNYIHRVGRTARAGRGGQAITFVTPKDVPALRAIEKRINTELTELKVSEKEVSRTLLQVEVAFREAAVSLEDFESDQRKENYKRKQRILDGKDVTPRNKKIKKDKQKKAKTVEIKSKKQKTETQQTVQ